MDESELLKRITVNPKIFWGKPMIKGRRLAVEHVLGMLGAGDTPETLLEVYPWLEPEDIRACLVHARRLVGWTTSGGAGAFVGDVSREGHREGAGRVGSARAAKSHGKRTLRRLHCRGIRLSQLRKCSGGDMAL